MIAAILLLAIGFTAMMTVAGSSIDLTQNAAERSRAAMWARSLLDSAFVFEPVQAGSHSGRFDSTYAWQLDVTPWAQGLVASPNQSLRLYQLDLTVRWKGGGHARNAHFRSLRAAGPPPPPGSAP